MMHVVSNTSFKDMYEIQKYLADVNLHLNNRKTEYMKVRKSNNKQKQKVKKVVFLLINSQQSG